MDKVQEHKVDQAAIKKILKQNKVRIKTSLKVCAHCSLCAESCFLFNKNDNDPKYMPSHKFINSLGFLYRQKGKINIQDLQKIKDIVWGRCVLCTRCYCPLGVDIPGLISLARQICRTQGVHPDYAPS